MAFLRRKKSEEASAPAPAVVAEEISGSDHVLKLAYLAKSSEGLRLPGSPDARAALTGIVEPLTSTRVEKIDPLPREYGDAAPMVERFEEMQQWVGVRRELSPVARHALYVLELTGAVDMTVDSLVSALLHGETDTRGYPDYNAIVGGLASHYDEMSGELIVRSVVGWGGEGQRGDTERIGQKLLSGLYAQVIASGLSLGVADHARMTLLERSGAACAHCGFDAATGSAFYCPKCGMRMA